VEWRGEERMRGCERGPRSVGRYAWPIVERAGKGDDLPLETRNIPFSLGRELCVGRDGRLKMRRGEEVIVGRWSEVVIECGEG
jgi:hypothetical protein